MGFLNQLLKPFSKREDPIVRHIYDQLVAQARHPDFYRDQRVDDTVSGRFDMIVLHAFIVFYRLKHEDGMAKALGQDIFDTFIEDMDRSLREMGVGYQAVPKRMRTMGEAFYGRLSAYDKAASAQDRILMGEALKRNIPSNKLVSHKVAQNLSTYVFANIDIFDTYSLGKVMSGEIGFADPADYMND